MLQLTREQAIEIGQSGIWKTWTSEQVVKFQLYQTMLCMDFSHFHKCVEEIFGRPVFTHEFANSESLQAEFEGKKSKPTLQEILDLLPKDKTLLIVAKG